MAGLSGLRLKGAFYPLAAGALALAMVLLAAAVQPARATPILLVDAESGKVLEQQEAGRPWYPASVTKLMTVYVALNAVREGRVTMDTLLTVSPLAASQSPTKMGFGVGTKVTLDNALKMLMVKSANDMAVTIAEGVGGSHADFIQEMNATASRLGMTGTHYENPNGLPDAGQVTTARDLAILARHLIYDFPEYQTLFRLPAIRLGKILMRNYNRLIDRYPGADGMKTASSAPPASIWWPPPRGMASGSSPSFSAPPRPWRARNRRPCCSRRASSPRGTSSVLHPPRWRPSRTSGAKRRT